MLRYPVKPELREAIELLFKEDPSVGLGFLDRGIGFLPVTETEESLSPNLGPGERAKRLRKKLETYVIQMAAESDELGAEETFRLRSEATSLLVVLRELQNHFPEAFQ